MFREAILVAAFCRWQFHTKVICLCRFHRAYLLVPNIFLLIIFYLCIFTFPRQYDFIDGENSNLKKNGEIYVVAFVLSFNADVSVGRGSVVKWMPP